MTCLMVLVPSTANDRTDADSVMGTNHDLAQCGFTLVKGISHDPASSQNTF